MLEGADSGFGRPQMDRRDFDRVGRGAGGAFSSLALCGSDPGVGVSVVEARASSTFFTPWRTSSAEAP